MRRRSEITLQRDDTEISATGAVDPWTTVTDVATIWAEITAPTESEATVESEDGLVAGHGRYTVNIRWRALEAAADRLRVKVTPVGTSTPRYLSVLHVPVVDRRARRLNLVCEEIR